MTIDEAIKVINPDDHDPGAVEILNRFDDLSEGVREAHRVVIAALRVQQTPARLDRSWWKGCFICKGETYLDGDVCISGTHYVRLSQFNFCPDCGYPLTEEAWAELERRINGGTADIF